MLCLFLAALIVALIASLRVLFRTRNELATAQFVLAQRESVRRKDAALRLAISENPSSYHINKFDKEIYILGLHDSQRLETIPTTVKVYRFNNAEEEAYAQLLAEELLDKLNEDV